MLYLFFIVICIYCIIQFDIKKKDKQGKKFFYFLLVYLIVLSGFSYRLGVDIITSEDKYREVSDMSSMSWRYLNSFYGKMPGWIFFCTICKTIVSSFWFLKLIHAIIVNTLIFLAIKNNIKYVFSGILVYFCLIYFEFNFQILRESIAISVFLFSLRYFYDQKWTKYYLMVIICISFHESAIVLLFIPIIRYFKTNFFSLSIVTGLAILIIVFAQNISDYLLSMYLSGDISDKIAYYSEDIDTNKAIAVVNFLINVVFPVTCLFVFKEELMKVKYVMLIIVYALIYSMGLWLPIMYRFNQYFILLYFFFYLEIFKILSYKLDKKKRQVSLLYFTLYLIFILFRARMYFTVTDSGQPVYVQYYPYSSIFTKEVDANREKYFIYYKY